MRWRETAGLLLLALIGGGCAHGGGTVERVVPPFARGGEAPPHRLAIARSTLLRGEPGGIGVDGTGAVVQVDDRTVVAFDPGGREQWSAPVPGASLGWPWLGSGLVVVPTTGRAHTGADELATDDEGADDSGGCVAVDRADGSRRWSYEEEGDSGVAVASAGSRVFCLLADGVVAALDRASGSLVWRAVLLPGEARSSVSVSERTAMAVDPTTGSLLFGARVAAHWFLAVRDLATGADRGVFDLGGSGPPSAPLSVGPGLVALGTADPAEVCVADLRVRRFGTCVAVPGPSGFDPASIPVVAHGDLVIAARDGSVSCVDLAHRRRRWTVAMPTPVLDSRLSVAGNVVLFADWARVPWALRVDDGAKVAVPAADGFVISSAARPTGGFDVAVRGDPDGRIERWVPDQEPGPAGSSGGASSGSGLDPQPAS